MVIWIRFGNWTKLKIFTVVVIAPLTLNTLQFIIQDMFLKKSDFEITDIEVMKKYYDCTEGEDLETSLNQTSNNVNVEMHAKDIKNIDSEPETL